MSKRILLIEDDETVIDFLSVFFDEKNIDFDITKKPKSALSLMDKNTYRLIFLDVSLGADDGSQYASLINKNSGDATIIMCTAKDRFWLQKNMDIKVRHLKKPFRIEELIDLLTQFNIL
ncbi:MAG: response regulator [Candidatus Zixiibacteriota bacterium]